MSPTRLRRNGANATDRNSSNNTAAAALQDVADAAAAAAANCEDPNIFNAVLKAPPPLPRHLQTAGSEPHRVTDEEDGHPRLGRRGPEPGVVDSRDPPAHQRQESPTLTQSRSLEGLGPSRASTIHQQPTAS